MRYVGIGGVGINILFGVLVWVDVRPPIWVVVPLLAVAAVMILVSIWPAITMTANLIWRIRLRIPITLASTNAGVRGDAALSKPSDFDPYTISSYLAQVDLTGLSQPDSFLMITLNVRNASGYPVTITGVKGRIRCAGSECNSAATVEQEPRQLRTSAYDRVPCTIRQPISNGMMQVVAREALAGNIVISLSGLQWVGSVALP